MALAGAAFSVLAWLMISKMGREVTSSQNSFYFGVYATCAMFCISLVLGDTLFPYSLFEASMLTLIGLLGFLNQHFINLSVQSADMAKVAPVNYIQVAIAWVADVVLFGKEPTMTEMAGTFCIVFFSFFNSIQEGFCSQKSK